MSNRQTNFLVVALAAVLLGVFYWIWQLNQSKFDWSEQFRDQKAQPYDLSAMRKLLSSYFPNHHFSELKTKLADELPADGAGKNYCFVGEAMFLDSLDEQRLVAFVKTGGTALLSSKVLPIEIGLQLTQLTCDSLAWFSYESFFDTLARLNFEDKVLKINDLPSFQVVEKNKARPYWWHHIRLPKFCDDTLAPFRKIGSLNDSLTNFVEWKFGSGRFLFHSNPVVFTNYFLSQKHGRDYTTRILSFLPDGDLFYDEKSRTDEALARARNERHGGPPSPPRDSPLAFILKKPSLAWAWYLAVGLAVFFLIFRGKRRQRVIPVIQKPENASLEFIKTVGNMAFRGQNHVRLSRQKMRLFLSFVRDRYGLAAARPDLEFQRKLSLVSEVSEAQIASIFNEFHTVESNLSDERTMIALHKAMENFYKTCK